MDMKPNSNSALTPSILNLPTLVLMLPLPFVEARTYPTNPTLNPNPHPNPDPIPNHDTSPSVKYNAKPDPDPNRSMLSTF